MKKNRLFLMAGALCAALGLGSCSNEMDDVAVPAEGATRTVTLTVSLPGGGADTRTAYAVDGTGLKGTWADGDMLTAVCGDITKSTTFTLTSGAGTDTATFTGEIPEDVAEGDIAKFYYPAMIQKNIDGVTHYIWPDYRTEDGTLEGLSKVDAIDFTAEYSGGKLNVSSSGRHISSFLHFVPGTAVASAGAGSTATFTISRAAAGYDYTAKAYFYEDIVVSNVAVNSDGTLANDVYIAFQTLYGRIPTLTITVGSEKKVYSLDRSFSRGTMYNINDLSKLTEIKVGMVIGSNGKYYATATAMPSDVTAEAMIAFLGKVEGVCDTGLAIALEDVGGPNTFYSWDGSYSNNSRKTAAKLVADWAANHKINGDVSGWRLPSAYDWQRMLIGCGSTATYIDELTDDNDYMGFSYGDIHNKLIAAGGESADVGPNLYWASTEYGNDCAWIYCFYTKGTFWISKKSDSNSIRAVYAF